MSASRIGVPVPSGWPDEHRACQREAAAGAPELMRSLLDHARAALRPRLPGRSAPVRQLERFAALLQDGFQAHLARAIQAPPPVPATFAWPALPDADKAESRRYQAEADAADMQFAEFDMLWVAAVPLDALGRQPLHPANYLDALQAAVEMADVVPDLHRLWLRHLRAALPGRLAGVYLRLASGLEAAGVQPTTIEARRAAQTVAVVNPVVLPVDLATFSERFAQRFEHTLPPDSLIDPTGDRTDREDESLMEWADTRPAEDDPPADAPSFPRAAVSVAPAGAVATARTGSASAQNAALPLPAEGAWLEWADEGGIRGAAPAARRWRAWQVAWRGAGGRLWLLRDAEGRDRSLTRSVFLRLQREGRLRLR